MPLVTLTCSQEYFPPDQPLSVHAGYPTTEQLNIMEFARALPSLMAKNAESLHLAPDTPSEGVQVDIQKFHTHAVNAVEVWIKIELSEVIDDEVERQRIRERMINLIVLWLHEHNAEPQWALDIFFGPATGCLADKRGIQLRW